MLTLEELIENDSIQSAIWLERMYEYENGFYKYSANFYSYHLFLAIKAIKNKLFEEAKNNFNICGLIDEYRINNFNSRFFDYGLHHISNILLSDNEELIQRYSKLRYYRDKNAELSMDEMVQLGESPIWCNTVHFFMINDNKGIERNLNIIETKSLKKLSKKEEGLLDDYEFYKALYYGDKYKMEEVLEKLTSPKIHKKRNDDQILNKYISLPALGYAKLAWRKGIEVNVESNLIPKDLLPLRPLDSYEIPYDFLK